MLSAIWPSIPCVLLSQAGCSHVSRAAHIQLGKRTSPLDPGMCSLDQMKEQLQCVWECRVLAGLPGKYQLLLGLESVHRDRCRRPNSIHTKAISIRHALECRGWPVASKHCRPEQQAHRCPLPRATSQQHAGDVTACQGSGVGELVLKWVLAKGYNYLLKQPWQVRQRPPPSSSTCWPP